jgi:hypothetical protein
VPDESTLRYNEAIRKIDEALALIEERRLANVELLNTLEQTLKTLEECMHVELGA